jgi:hypothetical protein
MEHAKTCIKKLVQELEKLIIKTIQKPIPNINLPGIFLNLLNFDWVKSILFQIIFCLVFFFIILFIKLYVNILIEILKFNLEKKNKNHDYRILMKKVNGVLQHNKKNNRLWYVNAFFY